MAAAAGGGSVDYGDDGGSGGVDVGAGVGGGGGGGDGGGASKVFRVAAPVGGRMVAPLGCQSPCPTPRASRA